MAISKVVYKSSSSATPVVWMDATPATASASNIISPYTAMLADGIVTQGTGSGGGGGLEYETGTYTPVSDIAQPTISFTNSHSGRPIYITILDDSSTGSSLPQADSALVWSIMSYYDLGRIVPYGASNALYGRTHYTYKTNSTYSTSGQNITKETGTDYSALSFFMDNTGFSPYLASTTRYFRSGVNYKWIAVWAPST